MQWFEPSLDKMGPIQVQHLGRSGSPRKDRDFPFLAAAFRCISRCEGGSEERKNRVGSRRWGVALRVGIQEAPWFNAVIFSITIFLVSKYTPTLGLSTMQLYLKRWGFSAQKPLTRATQCDPAKDRGLAGA